jgi:hypothetical protein
MNNQSDILDAAVSYIKELKEMVEQLEQRRRSFPAQPMDATGGGGAGAASTSAVAASRGVGSEEEASNEEMAAAAAAPVVLARLQPPDGSSLDVTLVTGAQQPLLMLPEVIAVLEEEGAEVLNATLSVVAGRRIFCSVHSRVRQSHNTPQFMHVHATSCSCDL